MVFTDENSNNSPPIFFSEGDVQISIVVPAYNENKNLRKLYTELMKVLPSLNMSWEIIFVDDGSTDNTWEEILLLHKKNKAVKGVRFTRNFGHQFALYAGLSHAVGEAVISMDADLQHPPHLIPELIKNWQNGSKIVHTIRSDPEDYSPFKKISSHIFYRVFTFCSGVKISPGMADFRLLDRQALNRVLQFREQALFLRGIVKWVGYPSSSVNFQSSNRHSGTSHYTFKKMVRFAWHGISSFSIIPLRIAMLVGIFTSGIAFSGILYALYSKFIIGTAVPGWTSSVAILSFLLGILFLLLGLIGEYIGRILIEVKQRPRFIISDRLGTQAFNNSHNKEL